MPAVFSCLFAPEHHVGQRLRRFRLCLVDRVGIDIQRRGHVGMSQPVCNCDHVHAVSNQHGSVRMPEAMRVQVREVVSLREFAQPARKAVRVDRCAVALDEQKAAVLPAVAVFEPEFIVPRAVLPKELHRLLREREERCVLCFCGALVNERFLGQAVRDVHVPRRA